MEPVSDRSQHWKALFIRAAGFGAGVGLTIGICGAVAVWYVNRPESVPAWNRHAITAKYADLYVDTGYPSAFIFRYTVENHTGTDYHLPPVDSLYKVLSAGKGLEQDATLRWQDATVVLAGQKLNVGIHVEYSYSGRDGDLKQLSEFTNRRLAEIDGFAALDRVHRYDIRFPKAPAPKASR